MTFTSDLMNLRLISDRSLTAAMGPLPFPPDDGTVKLVELSPGGHLYKNVEELVCGHTVHGALPQSLSWKLDGLCHVEAAFVIVH